MRHAVPFIHISYEVAKVLGKNPQLIPQIKAKPSLAGWVVGQVMKATGGMCDPAKVQAEVLLQLGI